jgi:hypothetical protein
MMRANLILPLAIMVAAITYVIIALLYYKALRVSYNKVAPMIWGKERDDLITIITIMAEIWPISLACILILFILMGGRRVGDADGKPGAEED